MSNRIKAIERLNNNYAKKFGNPSLRESLFRENAQKVSAQEHRVSAPQQHNQVRIVRKEVPVPSEQVKLQEHPMPRRSIEVRNIVTSQHQPVQNAVPVVSLVQPQNAAVMIQRIPAKPDMPGVPNENRPGQRRSVTEPQGPPAPEPEPGPNRNIVVVEHRRPSQPAPRPVETQDV